MDPTHGSRPVVPKFPRMLVAVKGAPLAPWLTLRPFFARSLKREKARVKRRSPPAPFDAGLSERGEIANDFLLRHLGDG